MLLVGNKVNMHPLFPALVLTATLFATGCAPSRPGTIVADSASAGNVGPTWPGKQPDGSVQLPNQWSLRPVGDQVELADFPINVAVHPGGRFVAILHSGYSQHQILCVDLSATNVVSCTRIAEAFYGLEFSRDGNRLFCSGAGDEVIHAFDFDGGNLSNARQIRLREVKARGVPAGLAIDAAGGTLWAANVWGHAVSRVEPTSEPPRVTEIALGTNTISRAPAPVTPSPDFDTAAAEKRAEALLYASSPEEPFPYACRVDEQKQRLYVSLWAQAAVAVLDTRTGELLARWDTEEHPCEMVLSRSGKYLFVANASRNTVTVLDTQRGQAHGDDLGGALSKRSARLHPQQPGPDRPTNRRCLSPTPTTTWWRSSTCARPGKSRSLGFHSGGLVSHFGARDAGRQALLVANGKGVIPKANPLGPQPEASRDRRRVRCSGPTARRSTLASSFGAP